MGLFDFLSRKKEPEYPKEYYWAQKSGEELRSECTPTVSFWNPMDSENYEEYMSKGYFCSGSSYGTITDVYEKLEMACEKGDPEAPFYLAIFWKYGLKGDRGYVPEKAEPYFYMAKERGSKMEQAYQYLLEHRVNPELDPDDHVATSMAFTAYGEEDKHKLEVRRILGDDLCIPFSRLGVAMMAAGCNFGGSTKFVLRHYDSAVCLAQLIIVYARSYDNKGNQISDVDPFFKNVLVPVFGYPHTIQADRGIRLGNIILEYMIHLAARGDKTAAYVLQKYKVKP